MLLFRGDVVNQSVYFGIAQLSAEGGHNSAAEFNSEYHVGTAWLSVAERKFFVLEQTVQTWTEFSGVFLILINIVADGAVLAKQIASCDQ